MTPFSLVKSPGLPCPFASAPTQDELKVLANVKVLPCDAIPNISFSAGTPALSHLFTAHSCKKNTQ